MTSHFCRCEKDDRLCQVQDCYNRHQWFYGPGLYLCAKHVSELEVAVPPDVDVLAQIESLPWPELIALRGVIEDRITRLMRERQP